MAESRKPQHKGADLDLDIETRNLGANDLDKGGDDLELDLGDAALTEASELRPKLDHIIADVQSNIPSLDFEGSSVSSDEELSIFNRSMKTPRSERGGEPNEDLLTAEAWQKALEATSAADDVPVQAPTYEYVKLSSQDSSPLRSSASFKSSMPKVLETTDGSGSEATSPRVFNRRLMAMHTFAEGKGQLPPSRGHDLVPRNLIPSIADFDEEDDDEDDALNRSAGSSLGHSDSSLGQSSSSLQTVISSVVAESLGLDFDDLDVEDRSRSFGESIDEGEEEEVEDGILEVARENRPADIIEEFSKPQELDTMDNRQIPETEASSPGQNEEDAIVMQMLPADAPTLAIDKVDFIDLDLLIDAFPERSEVVEETSNNPPSARGDGGSEANTCLMDRLAQLCIAQSGGQLTQSDLHPSPTPSPRRPQGLATKPPRPPPKVVWEDKTSPSRNRVSTGTSPSKPNETPPKRTTSTSTSTGMDYPIVSVGESRGSQAGGRVVGLQRSRETVYLDLRPKETEEEEASWNPSKAAQRILQHHSNQSDSSSSDDSSDDEDSALNWHEKRRKMMQKLGQDKGHASADKTREAARDREPMRKVVTKPHRVIHMVHQETTASCDSGTQTPSAIKMRDVSTHLDLPPTPPQSPASQGSRTPQRKSSLTDHSDVQQQRLKEKDRERNAAVARRLREQKERDRQERLKLQKKLESLRPQATASTKKKESARATDIVFDVEASYKPESLLLPSNLKPAHETVLLTVTMATSGGILLNKGSSRLDKSDGEISATYGVLLSWLLSLVPDDMGYLDNPSVQASCGASGIESTPFRVIGLQQVWRDNRLQLQVAITPPCIGASTRRPTTKQKKGKLRDEVRDMTPFQQTVSKFLTSKNLHTLAAWMPNAFRFAQEFSGEPIELPLVPMDVNREGVTETGTYIPPYPLVSSKPLATYVSMGMGTSSVDSAFSVAPGFFWRTIDGEESIYDQLTNEEYNDNCDVQNTLTLLHDSVYYYPSRVAGVLYRLLQEGMDLSGFRLMYNSTDLLTSPRVHGGKAGQVGSGSEGRPVVVLAIRGNLARTRWLDAVGPSDPLLAKRTDPYSLMALYGGVSRDDLTIVCPRNPSRINYELSLWFGARVTDNKKAEVMRTVEGGPLRGDRRVRSESPKQKKGKRGSRKDSWSNSSNEDLETVGLSPATLLASTTGDAVLAISPLVPPMCLGMILSTCQERGYQFRGIRRLRLNARRASVLGMQGKQVSIFSPMSCSTPTSPKNCEETLRKRLEAGLPASTNPPLPSILVHLRGENAMRNMGSLIHVLMVQLSRQGLLPSIQANAETTIKSSLCFHVVPFSDNLLQQLGGDFSRIPEHDVYHGVSVPSTFYSNPELEQIVVVTFCGAKTLKLLGNTLGKLLGVYPVTSTNNVTTPRASPGEGLELIGVKFLPTLTAIQAKELTPFEVGDKSWQPSIHCLVSNPAVVCVLRGINAFHHVRSVLAIPTHPNDFRSRGVSSGKPSPSLCLERLMSASAEIAFRQASMFFRDHELFADPSMRANLPYQPPLRSPSLEELSNARFAWAEDTVAKRKKQKYRGGSRNTPVPDTGTVLVEESIFKTMLAGPRPITTVLVIKPGAIRNFSKILKRVCQEDFTIVGMRLLSFDDRQARALVPSMVDADGNIKANAVIAGMHMGHLRSGPSAVLVLQRENAVRKLLSVLGPGDPKEAKAKSEFLWRGMFGADPINNAFHCSASYVKAVEEQLLFFPEGLCCRPTSDLKADKIPCPAVDTIMGVGQAAKRNFMLRIATPGGAGDSLSLSTSVLNGEISPRNSIGVGTSTADLTLHSHSALCQTNCILLTPPLQLLSVQGHRKGYVDVIDCLRQRGFLIVSARMVWMNQGQAKEFVSIYSGAYPNLVQLLCHGPSIILAIQRDNAVSCLGSLLGNILDKDSVINKYGKHILRPKDTKEAIKHLEFFFDQLMPGSQGEIVSEDVSLGLFAS